MGPDCMQTCFRPSGLLLKDCGRLEVRGACPQVTLGSLTKLEGGPGPPAHLQRRHQAGAHTGLHKLCKAAFNAKEHHQVVRNHRGSSGAAALPGLHVMGQTLVAHHPAAPQQGKL